MMSFDGEQHVFCLRWAFIVFEMLTFQLFDFENLDQGHQVKNS